MTSQTNETIDYTIDSTGLHVSWNAIRELLGRDHEGNPADDKAVLSALVASGAPTWASSGDPDGYTDEYGWGICRPTVETTFDGPAGPVVDYWDHTPEQVEGAIGDGWSVDYSSQITLASGQYRAPLVRLTKTYTLRDEDGTEEKITAEDDADANAQAREWVLEGDWDTSGGTVWVDVTVTDEDDEFETITVAVDPAEPKCSHDDGHDWQSPHSVLGGSEDNPGVQGHGGGVIIREVCAHCGAYKTVDTWAQRSDTGEQGLRSTSYQDADDESLAWVESLTEDDEG